MVDNDSNGTTRYAVMYTTIASSVVYVDADSREDAEDKASEEFAQPTLCAQCAGFGRYNDGGIELGEWEQATDDYAVWKVES